MSQLFQHRKTERSYSSKSIFIAKVVSAKFNSESPDEIGSITYKFPSDDPGVIRGEAFPLQANIKNIPMKDELIVCLSAPSEYQEETSKGHKAYYLHTVNIWNHPQHAGYPKDNSQVVLHPSFPESTDVNPLQPYPGDIIFEGRRGQSVRFSETQADTPWRSEKKNQPVIVISNGQTLIGEGFSFITEDVNNDPASIYLAADAAISEFGGTYSKVDSFTSTPEPIALNTYQGHQIFANSGRIVLNANTERVLINGQEGVGLAGRSINIDGVDNITLDAPKLYLTSDNSEDQPAVLGRELIKELTATYRELGNVASQLAIAASQLNDPILIGLSNNLASGLNSRATTLENKLLSNRVFLSK